MLLRNENIFLRAVEPEDIDHLYKWENDPRLWIHGNTLSPYSKYTLRQYIEEAQQYDIFQSNQLRMVICRVEDQSVIGAIDIYDVDAHSRRAGVGVLVDDIYRGNGYALQALSLLQEYCFKFLNLHQLYAHISVENKNSLSLFEKAGYRQVGILKDWIHMLDGFEDVILLQLLDTDE